MQFESSYDANVSAFDRLFGIGKNYDFVSRELIIAGHRARFYYIDSFVNSQLLERLFIYLAELTELYAADSAAGFAAAHLPHAQVSPAPDADTFVRLIMAGTVGFFLEDFAGEAINIDMRVYPSRSVQQSENDRVLRGAHDSFVEGVKQNSTLIRRRIRDPRLTFELFPIGTASKSDIVLAYIGGRADPGYVEKIRNRLKSIRADALSFGPQSLAECLMKQKWYNPFPKFRYTERPDNAAAHLLEGSIILLCDTSPEAMILPTCIFDFMQETDDFYYPPLTGSYLRLLRYAVFLLTMLLTPTWYLFISHPEWIPEWMRFILIDTEYNIPIIVQLFIIEFALDGLKLASMNTPNSLNNTFGVVGGLILGDFAVQIGWFVPEVIVYMAFVAIANFSQSSYELGYAFKFMRMLLLLLTALLGLWGYLGGLVLIGVLIASNSTVNGKRNYLYPLIPWNGRAMKRLLIRERLRTDGEGSADDRTLLH